MRHLPPPSTVRLRATARNDQHHLTLQCACGNTFRRNGHKGRKEVGLASSKLTMADVQLHSVERQAHFVGEVHSSVGLFYREATLCRYTLKENHSVGEAHSVTLCRAATALKGTPRSYTLLGVSINKLISCLKKTYGVESPSRSKRVKETSAPGRGAPSSSTTAPRWISSA